jgi:hypothetical protein
VFPGGVWGNLSAMRAARFCGFPPFAYTLTYTTTVSLSSVKHHALKTYGRVKIWLQAFKPRHVMEFSGQLQASVTLLLKSPSNYRWIGCWLDRRPGPYPYRELVLQVVKGRR